MFVLDNGLTVNDGAAVLNGRGMGGIGSTLGQMNFDPGYMRPYIDRNDNVAVTVNTGRWTVERGQRRPIREHRTLRDLALNGTFVPTGMVTNATSLRKEEWIELDRVVLRSARYRLIFWADLSAANSFGGFNGMSKLILEHEVMSDPGEAVVDMNGITDGRTDAPQFQLRGLPLPITHSDFWYDARRLAVSRNTGTPLDTTMGEAAGRRVAESIEKTAIGVNTGVLYGGASTQTGGYDLASQVYGLITFPNRLTKTNGYRPTGLGRSGTGWVAADTLKDFLAALDQLRLNKFYGPFTVYHSNDWDQYLDNDYILTGGNVATQTLRERLMAIKGITDVKRLDFLFATQPGATTGNVNATEVNTLNPFTMIFVQMTPDVCRAVNGMDITTVQWETKGGMQLNFKVLCIQVPQLRSDFSGNCLSGDTKIITKEFGTRKTLRDLVGQSVTVLNRHNKWEAATVQSFGTQRLHQVNFEQMSPVLATAEHRWWQKDGTRVTTDKVRSIPFTEDFGGVGAKVVSVVDTGRDEEVFCCVVPGSESFTLANGLATSNCGILHATFPT